MSTRLVGGAERPDAPWRGQPLVAARVAVCEAARTRAILKRGARAGTVVLVPNPE